MALTDEKIVALDKLALYDTLIKAMIADKVNKELKTGSTSAYKVLSDNNLTDELVTKINNAGTGTFDGDYNNLTNKPTKLSDFTNDQTFQTLVQIQALIADAETGKATTTYVDDKITALIGGAPEALDTLKELADKLGSDGDAISALTTQIAAKANIADITFASNADINGLFA